MTLTRHMLREIAEQLNSLAENDRDAGHVDTRLVNLLRAWERKKLPGHVELSARVEEILNNEAEDYR